MKEQTRTAEKVAKLEENEHEIAEKRICKIDFVIEISLFAKRWDKNETKIESKLDLLIDNVNLILTNTMFFKKNFFFEKGTTMISDDICKKKDARDCLEIFSKNHQKSRCVSNTC